MSKELKALNGLFDLIHCQDSFEKAQEYFDIIEEALNKKQKECKQYLKWEDLEFPYGVWKNTEAVLNGTKYTLNCYKNCIEYTYVKIYLNGIIVADLCSAYKADKQFFNDLHLEVVENE